MQGLYVLALSEAIDVGSLTPPGAPNDKHEAYKACKNGWTKLFHVIELDPDHSTRQEGPLSPLRDPDTLPWCI